VDHPVIERIMATGYATAPQYLEGKVHLLLELNGERHEYWRDVHPDDEVTERSQLYEHASEYARLIADWSRAEDWDLVQWWFEPA
jgi:hypothetical protein